MASSDASSASSAAVVACATSVPARLCGLWRRVSLETPDAPRDSTTRVFWLQTPTLFADIRIPSTRAVQQGRARLDDYECDELVALAQQDGFAGHTTLDGDYCRWKRTTSFQPPTGFPDEGKLTFQGEEIVEDGIHVPYREVWRRVPQSTGDWIAERAGDRYLVAGGDWFLLVRARREATLEQAQSLLHLGAARSNCRDGLIALLDFEISLGRRRGAAPWRIELSTLPFREGQTLAPEERAAVGGP